MAIKIIIETIPHESQRYPTVGDWFEDADGALHIKVSDMGNDDYALLVAIHEIHEFWLCKKRGITDEVVTAFDVQFEKDREAGIHGENDEPGDHPDAPYRKEHFFATTLERAFALEMGVDWNEYDKAVMGL